MSPENVPRMPTRPVLPLGPAPAGGTLPRPGCSPRRGLLGDGDEVLAGRKTLGLGEAAEEGGEKPEAHPGRAHSLTGMSGASAADQDREDGRAGDVYENALLVCATTEGDVQGHWGMQTCREAAQRASLHRLFPGPRQAPQGSETLPGNFPHLCS